MIQNGDYHSRPRSENTRPEHAFFKVTKTPLPERAVAPAMEITTFPAEMFETGSPQLSVSAPAEVTSSTCSFAASNAILISEE